MYENQMVVDEVFWKIIKRIGWLPIIDVCCSRVGDNRIAPLFYCVEATSCSNNFKSRALTGGAILHSR